MKKSELSWGDNASFELILVAVIISVLMGAYLLYSVSKYNMLSSRSLVKSTVVMKVIQHDVKCVCPRCGAKGVPLCPQCKVPTYWNGYQGTFICPACGQGGFPQCPKCKAAMSWIEQN